MKKHKFDIEIKGNFIRIYIDKILHIMYKQDEFIGIQSYIDGDHTDRKYCIEIYTKHKKIFCEYDHIDKWKEILNLLDKIQ